ncbi:MAG: 3'(2'),5'-bisphosphate nucleotidase CysQ [Rhodospirillaceae bacterium]|nr:3'(2'),5'-bisphosphate nucleotidase CysQ [Rhodospirillaceae bacterium]
MTANIPLSLLDQLHEITVRAGKAIMDVYNTDFEITSKDDASPVTKADKIAEEIIITALKNEIRTPYPIVGEEAYSEGLAPTEVGSTFWLVDPLDGTKEFINRNGEFTVNIALIDSARPVLGFVYAPAKGRIYVGSPHGAAADIDGKGLKQINCRQMPEKGLSALVSRSHKSPEVDGFLESYDIAMEISAGSSLKFCLVASGDADIYPRMGRTMEWDTAAGHAVLSAAGGSVKDLNGKDLFYGKPGFENPHFVAYGKQ